MAEKVSQALHIDRGSTLPALLVLNHYNKTHNHHTFLQSLAITCKKAAGAVSVKALSNTDTLQVLTHEVWPTATNRSHTRHGHIQASGTSPPHMYLVAHTLSRATNTWGEAGQGTTLMQPLISTSPSTAYA